MAKDPYQDWEKMNLSEWFHDTINRGGNKRKRETSEEYARRMGVPVGEFAEVYNVEELDSGIVDKDDRGADFPEFRLGMSDD